MGTALLVFLVITQMGTPTSSSKWAYDLYSIKERHASQENRNKLLIVAGSNSLFGINSSLLESRLRIPTTNLGVHAGLGLKYILERSKRSLGRGDIVYLPLELDLYQQDDTPSAQLMDFVLARDPQYLHTLPIQQQILGFANVPIARIIEGLRGGSDRYLGSSSTVYNVHNVDSSGDQTNNTLEKARDYSSRLERLAPKDIGNTEISSHSKNLIRDYIYWARENGVCVIGGPPSLMKFEEYESERFLEFLGKTVNLFSDLGVHYVGRPADYLFPRELFFDTEYHLNTKGAMIRTQLIIDDLGTGLSAHCG
ncbi:hypothetical protein ACONUD_16390 [Microbulbifer harenosus]|uniref:DUF1574 domain-containing protein n=1 Tax=Microbulbifer harenosus TaxID=2576840 RepID=A0ABY2UEE4_9GAMM|nr:hypothetical protein [Microbulbifer harenosus]TLM75619.1 hypothetical protein FDY93_15075 [Microbulbifer harenosus]